MKKNARFGVFGLLVAAVMAAISAKGASPGAANVYLNVNVSLNGVAQRNEGAVGRVRFSTADVIAAIGHDTTNAFAPNAKLLLKIPVGLEAGPTFVVRSVVNRTNVLDFEVPSTMLWLIQIGDSVGSSRPGPGGVIMANQVGVWELAFQSTQGSFDVQGYTTAMLDNRGTLGKLLADVCPSTVSAKVAGIVYDANNNTAVVQGTVLLNGRKVTEANP